MFTPKILHIILFLLRWNPPPKKKRNTRSFRQWFSSIPRFSLGSQGLSITPAAQSQGPECFSGSYEVPRSNPEFRVIFELLLLKYVCKTMDFSGMISWISSIQAAGSYEQIPPDEFPRKNERHARRGEVPIRDALFHTSLCMLRYHSSFGVLLLWPTTLLKWLHLIYNVNIRCRQSKKFC